MKNIEQRASIKTIAQLHSAQHSNRVQLQAAANRLCSSMQAFERSLTAGNIFLSAVSGWAGLLRHINSFRRGYRLVTGFLETLRRRWK